MDEWLVNRDGSDRRLFVKGAWSAATGFAHGQSLYYRKVRRPRRSPHGRRAYTKLKVDGTLPVARCAAQRGRARAGARRTLYFAAAAWQNANEIYKAKPEDDERAELVTRFPASRVPFWPTGFALSPDGRWIAMLL